MPVKSLINNFYCYPMMGDITGIILVEMYKLKETYFMSVSIKGGIQL